MRNYVLAIAPTATIPPIVGVSQSIEPTYRNLFVKANMSGDFTVVNEYLVQALKARGRLTGVSLAVDTADPPSAPACSVENADCEACQ